MKKKKEEKKKTLKEIVHKVVWTFPATHVRGLFPDEIEKLFLFFEDNGYKIDRNYYSEALGCYTCEVIDGKTLTYREDVVTGITCGIEKRKINLSEFD